MSRHKSKAIPGRNLRLADQIQKDLAGIIQREIDTIETTPVPTPAPLETR